jgi:hypothetical protein
VQQPDRVTIRSFRVVFELERRLHRIDRWRLPLPHGLPLRSLAYGLAALAAVLALSALPLVGGLLRVMAAPVRLVVLPAALAYLLTRLRVDGRPAHRALLAWLAWRCSPRELAGLRPTARVGAVVSLGEVALVADWRSARYRGAVLDGPCSLVLRYPARARAGKRELRIKQAAPRPLLRGKRVRLREGQRLVIG